MQKTSQSRHPHPTPPTLSSKSYAEDFTKHPPPPHPTNIVLQVLCRRLHKAAIHTPPHQLCPPNPMQMTSQSPHPHPTPPTLSSKSYAEDFTKPPSTPHPKNFVLQVLCRRLHKAAIHTPPHQLCPPIPMQKTSQSRRPPHYQIHHPLRVIFASHPSSAAPLCSSWGDPLRWARRSDPTAD